MNHEQRLKIISQAWGRKLDDVYFCFFPWIDREEQAAAGTRRAGFHEGPAFEWPTERKQILEHMAAHEDHDLYWCPSLFEFDERKTENAVDERALWADLDEVDPRTIEDYPPTVAWETSPGRYQALWLLNQGDIRGASWEGGENQRLTYYIGADESGWDTTQLLRIPGWKNHKLSYRSTQGKVPVGKLLWDKGRRYLPDDFEDLPEVEGTGGGMVTDVVIDEVDRVDVKAVKARVRLKLTRRIRDYLGARTASGDRSDVLWEIETSLAEAGCSITEIVAIVRGTVWNKYEGRADEMKRLLTEATKASSKIHRKGEEEQATRDIAREDADEVKVRPLAEWLDNVKEPEWLVKGILTEGAVGFIAGEPKSFKSWCALDLAMSVASGARFLNYFDVPKAQPVLYLQEEDPPHTIRKRRRTIAKDKKTPHVSLGPTENGRPTVEFHPPAPVNDDAPIGAVLQGGLVLSDEIWQEWLDEALQEGYAGQPYGLVIIDTLMMVAGDVEENRSQEMTTKIFKPMKEVARKHGVALLFVHHMRKGGTDSKQRGGQRLLGSVANHAWAEDSMYLTLGATKRIEMECESKNFESRSYHIDGVGSGKGWKPAVAQVGGPAEQPAVSANEAASGNDTKSRNRDIMAALRAHGGQATVRIIATYSARSEPSIRRGLSYLEKQGRVRREGQRNWFIIK